MLAVRTRSIDSQETFIQHFHVTGTQKRAVRKSAKGAVVVKSQYKNDKCTQLTGYTIMAKTSTSEGAKDGGWKWQIVDENGSCDDCDAGASCAGCHQSCEAGPTHFCTEYQ